MSEFDSYRIAMNAVPPEWIVLSLTAQDRHKNGHNLVENSSTDGRIFSEDMGSIITIYTCPKLRPREFRHQETYTYRADGVKFAGDVANMSHWHSRSGMHLMYH